VGERKASAILWRLPAGAFRRFPTVEE
jgi:hypothetical protein